MKSRIFLSFIIIFSSFSISAQPDSSFSKTSYFNSFHSGSLFGKKGNGSSLSISTIHGICNRKVAFGIGIGYDAYLEWRTVPLFGSFGYNFAWHKENSFFLQMNAGYSKAWNPVTDNEQFIYDAKGGRYIHPVIGYRIHTRKFSLYLTTGYKLQRINYEQTPTWWIGRNSANKVTVERDIERLTVQLGFGFRY